MGSMMVNLFKEVSALISAAQHTAACHQKNSLLLRNIYHKSDFDKFYEVFVHTVDLVLQVDFKQKNLFVDRIIAFLGVFCDTLKRKPKHDVQEESFIEDPLITKLFEHLLEVSHCISDTVRFRSCQIINKILDHMVGNEISDELCEQMEEVLFDLLSDTKSVIRVQAVIALHRLQDPADPEDRIIKQFIQMMYDSHAKVRQFCIEKIGVGKDVISHMLKRSRDIDVNVRLSAFKRLAKFAQYLKIKDRRTLLFSGLLDPSDKVRQFVLTEFLSSWLELNDNNIIDFMKSVRLDADEKDIKGTVDLYENILCKFYFKTRSLRELSEVLMFNEEKVLSYEELNWETITYWKLYVEFLSQNEEAENQLANIIPEMVHFCRYIKGYTDYSNDSKGEIFLEKQHIIKQLFLILKSFDLADPISRQTLYRLVDFVLKTVDLLDDVVETIIGCLESTMSDPKIRCQFGCEIISDLLYPIDSAEDMKIDQEKEFLLSKLTVKLNCLHEEQQKVIAAGEYLEAERIKHELEDVTFQINNLKNSMYSAPVEEIKKTSDLSTICKCLDIAWALLRTAKVPILPPSLKTLENEFISEMMAHENEIIKMKALKCYAICCIYDKPTAQNGIHIFAVPIAAYQAGEECDTQTLVVCISAVSDLIRIYSADLMAEPNEDQISDSMNEEHEKVFIGGTSLTSLIQGLVDLMDDEQYEIQSAAIQGLCKLVLDERIHSPQLISRLILKWCHPFNKDEPESESLKQYIGYILGKIPHLPNSSEQLEGAVLTTVNTLARAPRISPLADIDIDNIAKFMLALCKLSSKGQQIHANIALTICTKINQDPDNKINSIYSKMLLLVDIPDDAMIKNELMALSEKAREETTDKTTLKNITKFIANLREIPRIDENMSAIPEDPEQLEQP